MPIEPITHTSRRTAGDEEQAGVDAIRFPITTREIAASGGVYTASDVVWSVQRELLSYTPKLGDWITDEDGTRWVIQDVSLSRLTGEYKFTARDLVLALDLRDTVDVWRPTYDADAAGSGVADYGAEPVYEGLAARIQETDGTVAEAHGREVVERRYTIYLADRVTLQAGDQVRDGEVVYEVIDYREPDRIDVLMQVNVIRRT